MKKSKLLMKKLLDIYPGGKVHQVHLFVTNLFHDEPISILIIDNLMKYLFQFFFLCHLPLAERWM